MHTWRQAKFNLLSMIHAFTDHERSRWERVMRESFYKVSLQLKKGITKKNYKSICLQSIH